MASRISTRLNVFLADFRKKLSLRGIEKRKNLQALKSYVKEKIVRRLYIEDGI